MRWTKGQSGNPTGRAKDPTKPRLVRLKGPNRQATARRKRNRLKAATAAAGAT